VNSSDDDDDEGKEDNKKRRKTKEDGAAAWTPFGQFVDQFVIHMDRVSAFEPPREICDPKLDYYTWTYMHPMTVTDANDTDSINATFLQAKDAIVTHMWHRPMALPDPHLCDEKAMCSCPRIWGDMMKQSWVDVHKLVMHNIVLRTIKREERLGKVVDLSELPSARVKHKHSLQIRDTLLRERRENHRTNSVVNAIHPNIAYHNGQMFLMVQIDGGRPPTKQTHARKTQ
jgi:hypothetical protein